MRSVLGSLCTWTPKLSTPFASSGSPAPSRPPSISFSFERRATGYDYVDYIVLILASRHAHDSEAEANSTSSEEKKG